MSSNSGSHNSCGECGSGHNTHHSHDNTIHEEERIIQRRMARIKHKLLILSGKGGVGKSTVSANIAMALASQGKSVGLMDIDVHGPSIPRLFGLVGVPGQGEDNTILPVIYNRNLKVISMGFFLPNRDDAVIWRGPMKHTLIKQFLQDVDWGDLDYLVIDSPPGTGDEPMSIASFIGSQLHALIVTIPPELSLEDVRKSINFCKKVSLKILGVVENMSGFICPHCGNSVEIFKKGGGEKMAHEMGVPFLGSIPIEPKMVISCDNGTPYIHQYPDSPTAKAFNEILKPILALEAVDKAMTQPHENIQNTTTTKIAIPVSQGTLSQHFGHCEEFLLLDVDLRNKEIISKQTLEAPPHEPGLLPKWLHEKGANIIIAGGMGARAQELFNQNKIKVIIGASSGDPEKIAMSFLEGNLVTGENVCDH
ncbi:MAG: chromosome partitioning protein ParA [Candidatus Schekmanbacteria bacterium RBG_13_48_7]|uniref:Iron-sulfur cluster carrier protein n=1 Tax=Candidatus Schekmanbacteria bacterium RBG_13_48_7 TaxID=1817878 RepID=A0A1F7S043_9BACT|nr:MAG: chromosome partitioning protein ParA [Candidatus Schekmanbacteria bacterium RBG_13_48_7]